MAFSAASARADSACLPSVKWRQRINGPFQLHCLAGDPGRRTIQFIYLLIFYGLRHICFMTPWRTRGWHRHDFTPRIVESKIQFNTSTLRKNKHGNGNQLFKSIGNLYTHNFNDCGLFIATLRFLESTNAPRPLHLGFFCATIEATPMTINRTLHRYLLPVVTSMFILMKNPYKSWMYICICIHIYIYYNLCWLCMFMTSTSKTRFKMCNSSYKTTTHHHHHHHHHHQQRQQQQQQPPQQPRPKIIRAHDSSPFLWAW